MQCEIPIHPTPRDNSAQFGALFHIHPSCMFSLFSLCLYVCDHASWVDNVVPACFGSVRQKCLDEQKRRRQRATKKISTFIGTFVVCFSPYVVTR